MRVGLLVRHNLENTTWIVLACCWSALLLPNTVCAGEATSAGDLYELKYQFHPDQPLRSRVVHLVTTETRIRGVTQESKSRSNSVRVWRVLGTDPDGRVQFEHVVESVDMWQKVTGRPEVSYNSLTDKHPPPEYELAAESVGATISIVTVDQFGEVYARKDFKPIPNFGLGQITTPLPRGKVPVGHQWEFPTEIALYLPDGRVKRVKTRQLYTLESVKTGVATISVKTQVLTPVNDPRIQIQLMQQLANGIIKFDIDEGRILFRQIDWDETVIGFHGPDSCVKYLARYVEEYLPDESPVAQAR
ncbi:MAG: hypothetical protein KatS3mg110_1811 [Pirellulaceae bacterium]|nr:MAG: hypothetical protein KatS3mg110_1811 [Pirellulaceae bacterium]